MKSRDSLPLILLIIVVVCLGLLLLPGGSDVERVETSEQEVDANAGLEDEDQDTEATLPTDSP